MKLVVFGANGPSGRQVVRQALAAGHEITAVTRRPTEFPLTGLHLTIVTADVMSRRHVDAALLGNEAVISTYGVPYSRKPVTVYSAGIENIIAGMKRQGITRLVCVSSTTVAKTEAPGESFVWRRVLVPMLRRVVGRTVYNDMEKMEELVQSSDLDWTIVRPGGLFNTDAPTADPSVSTGRLSGRMTARADLAQTLLREAVEPEHIGSVIEVISRSQLPGLRTFARDAVRMGR